jgi:hypothetical protein
MERKDNGTVQEMLTVYRVRGAVDHKKTLAIPFEQRIPELVKQPGGRMRVSAAISSSILSAFKHIHQAKMDAEQIVELSEGIIDSAEEDQLAIEDVLLFLKDLLLGKMGKITDKVDMPLFFELFEKYRVKRYQTLEAIKYEEHLNLKNMGHCARSSSEITLRQDEDPGTVMDLMQTMYEGRNDSQDEAV